MKKTKAVRPDDVSYQFADGSIQLNTRLIAAKANDAPILMIEGDRDSLRYLGKVILAQAEYELDDGYGLSPKSAGNAFLKPSAEFGLYLLRTPKP